MKFAVVNLVEFKEHPIHENRCADATSLDIIQTEKTSSPDFLVNNEFDLNAYCKALLSKVFTLSLSDLAYFLDHQCSLVKDPFIWLNNLEKLIAENVDSFDTNKLKHRHIKLLTLIEDRRSRVMRDQKGSKSKRMVDKLINGFTKDVFFSFNAVKDHIKTLKSTEEQIAYLTEQIYEYRQANPEFINTKTQPFDKLCELEIEKLEKLEVFRSKTVSRNAAGNAQVQFGQKLQLNGQLNILADVFFQMMNKKGETGKPLITASIEDVSRWICANFLDKDGNELSITTIRTMLSPSKPDKRPKQDKRIVMNG